MIKAIHWTLELAQWLVFLWACAAVYGAAQVAIELIRDRKRVSNG